MLNIIQHQIFFIYSCHRDSSSLKGQAHFLNVSRIIICKLFEKEIHSMYCTILYKPKKIPKKPFSGHAENKKAAIRRPDTNWFVTSTQYHGLCYGSRLVRIILGGCVVGGCYSLYYFKNWIGLNCRIPRHVTTFCIAGYAWGRNDVFMQVRQPELGHAVSI